MIPAEDLRVSNHDPRPPGGQQVGLTCCGVKVEHLPTGLIAICVSERSQRRNRDIAVRMIEAGLTDPEFRG